jgi:hypothetical protein
MVRSDGRDPTDAASLWLLDGCGPVPESLIEGDTVPLPLAREERPANMPVVQGVSVELGPVLLRITVKATAPDGGPLAFVWSGAGLTGLVPGAACVDLAVAEVMAAPEAIVRVLVRNAEGGTVEAHVALDLEAGGLGTLRLTEFG